MNELAKTDYLSAVLYSETTSLARDIVEMFAKGWFKECKGKKNTWKMKLIIE